MPSTRLGARVARGAFVALVALTLTSCGLPRDLGGTTEHAEARGHIEAGVIAGALMVRFDDGEPSGPEIDVIEGFAQSLGLGVRWTVGPEHDLMDALDRAELDVVVGGLPQTTPWIADLGLSRPIARRGADAVVAAVPGGANAWLLALDRYIQEHVR